MDRYRSLALVLFGMVLGLACQGEDIFDTAYAADDCESWDIKIQDDDVSIPSGWLPFAWSSAANEVALRQCND